MKYALKEDNVNTYTFTHMQWELNLHGDIKSCKHARIVNGVMIIEISLYKVFLYIIHTGMYVFSYTILNI